jgi:hypothetical protein
MDLTVLFCACRMLTDTALKHLKPKEKNYKVTDRDGMYVLVRPSGTLTFQLDYRMNGRRETVRLGKYGPTGLSLARARELCIDAKRAIAEGRSPAIEKQREKRRLLEAKSFGELGEKWLTAAPHGGQHTGDAPVDLRARPAARVAQQAADRNYAR